MYTYVLIPILKSKKGFEVYQSHYLSVFYLYKFVVLWYLILYDYVLCLL